MASYDYYTIGEVCEDVVWVAVQCSKGIFSLLVEIVRDLSNTK